MNYGNYDNHEKRIIDLRETMETSKHKKIIIDLRETMEARDFLHGQSFFQAELRKAIDKIKELTNLAGRIKESKIREGSYNHKSTCNLHEDGNSASDRPYNYGKDIHYHEAISILGKRGIGKTSFMLTLERYIREHEKKLYEKLIFLPMIDPGMLEDAEYFLVTLTSLICQEIQKCGNFHKDEYRSLVMQWQESLKNLSNSFIALDGKAYREYMAKSFQSPEIMGDHALIRGCGGTMLTLKFHDFVAMSVKILNKFYKPGACCFVLMIDDIDTVYDRGWIIMENIRKYLTSAQIIVMIAGDTALFKLVIRNQLFKKSETVALGLRI
jgi:hypothetical protein